MHYKSNNVRLKIHFDNGRPFGAYTKYYENGNIREKGTFKNGNYIGIVSSNYESNCLKYLKYYNNYGKLDSSFYFFENGCKELEVYIKEGKRFSTYFSKDSCNNIIRSNSEFTNKYVTKCFTNNEKINYKIIIDSINQNEYDVLREVFFNIIMNHNHLALKVNGIFSHQLTKKLIKTLNKSKTTAFDIYNKSKIKVLINDEFDSDLVRISTTKNGVNALYPASQQTIKIELSKIVFNSQKRYASVYVKLSYKGQVKDFIYILDKVENKWQIQNVLEQLVY